MNGSGEWLEFQFQLSCDDARIAYLVAGSLKKKFGTEFLAAKGGAVADSILVTIQLNWQQLPLYRVFEAAVLEAQKVKTSIIKTKFYGEAIPAELLEQLAAYYLRLDHHPDNKLPEK